MQWIKWYQTVFLFVIYNIALFQMNSNYNYKYYIPIYLSLVISFVYIYLNDEKTINDLEGKFVDDSLEIDKSEFVNNQ